MANESRRALSWKLFRLLFINSAPAFPVAAYLLFLAMDIPWEKAVVVFALLVLVNAPLVGMLAPFLIIRRTVDWAFTDVPGEAPGAKLTRILKVPRLLELRVFTVYLLSGTVVVGGPILHYGRDPWGIPIGVAAYVTVVLLILIRQGLQVEETLRPYALAEFHARPQLRVSGNGLLWTRQRWYLPYVFALFIITTIIDFGLILGSQLRGTRAEILAALEAVPALRDQVAAVIGRAGGGMVVPMLSVGGFLLGIALYSAWLLARHQERGSRSVQEAIESLASGKPRLPDWMSTDEMGDLSSATAAVFGQLKAFSESIRESAVQLGSSAQELGLSNSKQNEMLTLQASALQETQVTAQEIRQTSLLASQRAEQVLQQTQRANEISRTGEAAVEQSLEGLQGILEVVREMTEKIRGLDEQTRQIATITMTVKDLADQSNLLALNAAIEAVRAGEHGKGFGVVAREIRSLADQSIRSTHNVRQILRDISGAIRSTAEIAERGSSTVTRSLTQVRAFGDNIRQMAGIVRENAGSVRQISTAVTQQNAGINEIFTAITELTKLMDETMARLRTSDDATLLVRNVAERVSGFVGVYR